MTNIFKLFLYTSFFLGSNQLTYDLKFLGYPTLFSEVGGVLANGKR